MLTHLKIILFLWLVDITFELSKGIRIDKVNIDRHTGRQFNYDSEPL